MLDAGRYLLGVAEIALLVGFAWLGASRVRTRLLPEFEGAPAHLATAVLALALLLWVAELLGSVGLFEPVPYLAAVVAVAAGIWALTRGWREGGMVSRRPESAEGRASSHEASSSRRPEQIAGQARPSHPHDRTRGRAVDLATLIALAIATVAVLHFAAGVRTRLSTGMTGFDSTWYHGPFAAGFFQSGDTWSLHFIAPQFLAWFYPANSEVFHAIGMEAFGQDILSPLLNLGWFVSCLVACWCIGRPYRVAPWSLALGAIALSVPALSDQAGEARNDIVGIFFLLAAVAVLTSAWQALSKGKGLSIGAVAVVGLAAGLAAGTKLNFLLPATAIVVGLAAISPRGERWRALGTGWLAALAGGGYWYLRNLVHAGNPLPWIHHLGPISLPVPGQGLGGREAHSVLDYLTDGAVWSDWFLPGLRHGLWFLWPLLMAMALAGLLLCIVGSLGSLATHDVVKEPRLRDRGDKGDAALRVAGFAGAAVLFAWLIAPTSASGPEGMPRGFESGLRYLVPALTLGAALLPTAPALRSHLRSHFLPDSGEKYDREQRDPRRPHLRSHFFPDSGSKYDRWGWGVLLLVAIAGLGYPIQRHYLQSRYADPSFTTPGLNAAFAWARDVSDARIAMTSTRQYPLYGTDLSNRVQFIGEERPHGGFEAPTTCRAWRKALNAGHYDYAVTSRDRIEAGKPPYPPSTAWTQGPGAKVVLRKPPTVVFHLTKPLDPSSCPS
jgi:hypothetical protein